MWFSSKLKTNNEIEFPFKSCLFFFLDENVPDFLQSWKQYWIVENFLGYIEHSNLYLDGFKMFHKE